MKDRLVGICVGLAIGAGVAIAGQPHMRDALNHLRQAREALEEAAGNKGGHRESAIELVDKAISQVEKGIEYAKE